MGDNSFLKGQKPIDLFKGEITGTEVEESMGVSGKKKITYKPKPSFSKGRFTKGKKVEKAPSKSKPSSPSAAQAADKKATDKKKEGGLIHQIGSTDKERRRP